MSISEIVPYLRALFNLHEGVCTIRERHIKEEVTSFVCKAEFGVSVKEVHRRLKEHTDFESGLNSGK